MADILAVPAPACTRSEIRRRGRLRERDFSNSK